MAIFLLGAYAAFVAWLIASPGPAMKYLAVLLGIPLVGGAMLYALAVIATEPSHLAGVGEAWADAKPYVAGVVAVALFVLVMVMRERGPKRRRKPVKRRLAYRLGRMVARLR